MPNTKPPPRQGRRWPAAHHAPPATSPYRPAVRCSLTFPRTTAAMPVSPATARQPQPQPLQARWRRRTRARRGILFFGAINSSARGRARNAPTGGAARKGSVSRSSRRARIGSRRIVPRGSCRGTPCRGMPYPGRSSRWIRTVGRRSPGPLCGAVDEGRRIDGGCFGRTASPGKGRPGRDSLTRAARRFASAGRARRDDGDRRPGLRDKPLGDVERSLLERRHRPGVGRFPREPDGLPMGFVDASAAPPRSRSAGRPKSTVFSGWCHRPSCRQTRARHDNAAAPICPLRHTAKRGIARKGRFSGSCSFPRVDKPRIGG